MAANYNYAHHYARLDKEQTQQGYGTYDTDRNASSNTGLQYPPLYGSAYSHQSHQDFSNSATQPAAQWQGVSSKQPSTYHSRGGSGSQDACKRNGFETSSMSRAEFRSNVPGSLTRNPPSQTAPNASSFYNASQPQYAQYQSQQQSQSGLAPHTHENSQYSRVPTRPMSVTSIASGQSDTMAESRQALPHTQSRAHPHSGHASSSQQPQSNQSTTPHRPQTAQQLSETVPANTSAARTSVSQSQHQSSSTVDPSQIYDPYLDIQRQATRNIEQQEAEKERRRQEKESAEAQSVEQARHEKGVQEAKKLASKATKTPRAKKGTSVQKPSTADDMSAAMTLMQTANANAQANPDATQSERDSLQTQMMEMFKKMREFNQKDPEMLSRLWQQERDQHLAQSDALKPSNPSDIATRDSTPTAEGKKRRGPKPGWKAAKAAAEAAGATATTTATGPDTPHNVATSSPIQSISDSTQTSQPSTTLATGIKATSGTVWPANKKGTLAQAAVEYLHLAPENKSRNITADQVSTILDTNPNYVELCRAIELKGFKIDRGMFAKHLLRATPASGQSKVKPSGSSTINVPMADAEARLQSGETLLSTSKSQGQPQSKPTTAAKARAPNSTAPQEDESRPAYQMTTKSKPAKKPRQRNEASASATPGPASKEELARKRTFGDLVDLTQLSDSEEEIFFPPAKRLDQGSADNADLSLPSPPQTDQDASSGRPKTHPTSTKLAGGQLDSSMPGSLSQGKRRVGRPPKNRTHGAGTPVGQSARPLGAPNTASPAGSMGYAALRAVDEHGNPIKKKGRPVGWRKWMQKDVGASPSVGKGPSVAKAKKADPEPVYQVYKCEWRDCRAELHNLATLRKHIHKVHGNCGTDGQWTCHWRECGFIQPITEANTHRTTSQFRQYTYSSIESWKGHVETVHLRPIAWKLGDGPLGGVSDRESELSEAYMSDRQGRRVTPQIDMPESDGAAMLRRFKRTAEEEARQEQANAERKKRETGIGVEKGGARLANEKRRQGFRDDDSDAQIIDNDDG
ncbi:hypothetical protein FH972_026086 [Carpinus fangiana]|uniref:C2H2-type domain-containing protein n=1 Tax=Carpinus fangiana TaxID=176857 RepID=A0A5N6L3F2_9ROSI|nr:hypothetical protein FH972_026086 [Carpinus fangiana]